MSTGHWPHAGQQVDVCLEQAPALRAVVDDVRAPEQLHLRLPVQRDGAPAPEVPLGVTVSVTWTSSAGQHVLPSTLVDRPEARVPLWKLLPEGEPVVVQRRAFVRVAESLRVGLRRDEDGAWSAALCDLSEGGARCVVRGPHDLQPGDVLQLHLSLDDREVDVPATVLSVEDDGDRSALRLQFADVGRRADPLRRRVLEQQQRARAVEQR